MSRYYVTTPIYYVTDKPHLGHAYTTIVADAVSRYQRLAHGAAGVRFLTGTDEHGQKVERIAAERGKSPAAYATEISEAYRAAWTRLHVGNDDFIRTTDADHEQVVQELWRRMEERGDIYEGDYEGWYCVACEQFYPDKELAPGTLCPVHKRGVEKVKERGFFFRLSAYGGKLARFYDDVLARTGRPFVEPLARMNEVRAFVDGGLLDLSVSRNTFSWGVPVPGRQKHVIYVWIDALTNYYTATRREALAGFWEDDVEIVHLMGKEITRFHAVYWPAMLMSAGLRTPTRIVAHGWWTVDGDKMSKTQGNVVDPLTLADDLDAATGTQVGADAFRYFVLREVPLGADGDFSHAALVQRYNAELANDLGNLLNRTLGMCAKYVGPVVTWRATDEDLRAAAEQATAAWGEAMQLVQPSRALEAVWSLVRAGNEFIEASAPWKQSKPDQEVTLWNALESCWFLAQLIEPFMPERAAAFRAQLGFDASTPAEVPAWREGRAYRWQPGTPLFPRLDEDKKKELLAKWQPAPSATPAAAPQSAPAAMHNSPGASAEAPPPVTFEDFARLDLRVARIVAAERVPKKDKLLKLQVDLGTETRTVVAGIGAAYEPQALVGKQVVFLANLAPRKIGGVVSEGMILAAGDEEILGLSALDRDVAPGTRVR